MSEKQKNRAWELTGWTNSRINRILSMRDPSEQRAILANLRRGVGKAPGEIPALWGVVFDEFPSDWMAYKDAASREEWGVYIAMTLFGLHQQGMSPSEKPMHCKGMTLGKALSRLAGDDKDARNRICQRFTQMATTADIKGMSYYLRNIVQMLRAQGIPLDYALLAKDIYQYQSKNKVNEVRLHWAQDFYRIGKENNA